MLAGKKQKSPTVWAEFLDGFEVEIKYRSREEIQQMVAAARTRKWDAKANAIIETLDEDKYRKTMASEIVVNWRGLNAPVLEKLVILDDYPEAEVPYSVDDCVWLLKESKFDMWVQGLCSQVEAFQAIQKAQAAKNS